MLIFIRYSKNYDGDIYMRLRDAHGKFWDFATLSWVSSIISDCKIWLIEYQDDDPDDSLYSAEASLPAGGPWIEEIVVNSTKRVIGYDNMTVPVESTTITLRQILYGYIGNMGNVFSKVKGSFVGSIDFYVCSYSDFSAGMNDPANATRVCTLNASGAMSNKTNIATSGEVLFMKFSSSPAFSCLKDTVINIYNSTNKGNVRVYVPLGVQYVASIGAYYPTTSSGLQVYENSQFISLCETAYGRALGMIPSINWDRISSPVQLTTTAVIT